MCKLNLVHKISFFNAYKELDESNETVHSSELVHFTADLVLHLVYILTGVTHEE